MSLTIAYVEATHSERCTLEDLYSYFYYYDVIIVHYSYYFYFYYYYYPARAARAG